VAGVARVNAASLWNLASAPGTPKNATVDTIALDSNTVLKWTVAEGVEAYEAVWRPTTAALWTNAVEVGRTGQVELELSKDNVVFGVRAVGEEWV
jgi:hypothetical protein